MNESWVPAQMFSNLLGPVVSAHACGGLTASACSLGPEDMS